MSKHAKETPPMVHPYLTSQSPIQPPLNPPQQRPPPLQILKPLRPVKNHHAAKVKQPAQSQLSQLAGKRPRSLRASQFGVSTRGGLDPGGDPDQELCPRDRHVGAAQGEDAICYETGPRKASVVSTVVSLETKGVGGAAPSLRLPLIVKVAPSPVLPFLPL